MPRKLVEKLDFSKGLVMALLLYLVGLFGDSYYVVVEKLPLLKAFMTGFLSSSTTPETASFSPRSF
ncbi:MAG: hypothetical protein ACLR2E_00950 [Lachnospiraceae bacterium]